MQSDFFALTLPLSISEIQARLARAWAAARAIRAHRARAIIESLENMVELELEPTKNKSEINGLTIPSCFFSTLSSIQESDLEENGDLEQFSGVIHDKDLLKKASNGNLLVLDRGAMEPDVRFYMELFKKYTDQGRLKEGQMVHSHFVNSRFQHYVVMQNTVLNIGYPQINEFREALGLYVDCLGWLQPNEFTFGSALKSAGVCKNGCFVGIVHWWKLLYVTRACNGDAQCSELSQIWRRKHRGCKKNELTFLCGFNPSVMLVFLRFIRNDYLQQLFEALLAACRMHKNMELGVYAAKHAVVMGMKIGVKEVVARQLIELKKRRKAVFYLPWLPVYKQNV
ncbi:hypothetical protein Sango_1645100 [Sesamum angolense]|uniref:Uncharacterized protein n=1 Tax=Sesamum angolense TaxID=2727404 RepID=A0AAE2BRH8_9LAMI|nr:hypothetical protein Sango_1645100 [Sesamum angolense]